MLFRSTGDSADRIEAVVYTRAGCHLCDQAKHDMQSAADRSGVQLAMREVDIDASPALRRQYSEDVPVVFIAGQEVFRHRFDQRLFDQAVKKGAEMTEHASNALAGKHCVPCRGGVPPLEPDAAADLGRHVPEWAIIENHHLQREFAFPDFRSALAFTNEIGELAESEGHHPDIFLRWGSVRVEIWTHKINGLTESDFVLASKIDQL